MTEGEVDVPGIDALPQRAASRPGREVTELPGLEPTRDGRLLV
ncbi:hypothetical protein [Streptomyces scopuliridis]